MAESGAQLPASWCAVLWELIGTGNHQVPGALGSATQAAGQSRHGICISSSPSQHNTVPGSWGPESTAVHLEKTYANAPKNKHLKQMGVSCNLDVCRRDWRKGQLKPGILQRHEAAYEGVQGRARWHRSISARRNTAEAGNVGADDHSL